MKKVFLMAALFAVSGMVAEVSAQTIGDVIRRGDPEHPKPHKCPKPTSTPKVSYNSTSTVLNVSFSGNSQGGKVEIYRSGVKVVNTSAPAGASLSFVLRNYGKGDYTIIVIQGNMVIFSENMRVK